MVLVLVLGRASVIPSNSLSWSAGETLSHVHHVIRHMLLLKNDGGIMINVPACANPTVGSTPSGEAGEVSSRLGQICPC